MDWKAHHSRIENCTRCPRLRQHCLHIAHVKRAAFATESYWGKPIIGFGDEKARFMIVGLAPAAHGANRTGRMFTGDRSGEWLYRALYKAKFANQPTYSHADDGLKLFDTWVTASVRCAPPENKPTLQELAACSEYLKIEIENMTRARVYLTLGKIGFDQLRKTLKELGWKFPEGKLEFKHGAEYTITHTPQKLPRTVLCSYHPSQQNTFTKRLTEPMFDTVFKRAYELLR